MAPKVRQEMFRSLLYKWDKVLFICASLVLVFTCGMLVSQRRVFPHELLQSAVESARDLRKDWKIYLGIEPTKFLAPAKWDGEGVVTYEAGKAQPGVTFMTGFFGGEVALQLVDMNGTVVQRWPARFSEIWPSPDHVEGYTLPTNDWLTDIHGALLLEDGSVVFNFEFLGLVKLDHCGRVVWTLPYMTHHSAFLGEDETIWVCGRRYHASASENLPKVKAPFWEDIIVQVSPEGQILNEISLLQLFFENKMEGLLFLTGKRPVITTDEDPLHLNDVEVLTSDIADAFPLFEAGDIMVSSRFNNLLMVIDPTTQRIKWHQSGPWLRQHDPDFQSDGRISLFDNRGVSLRDHRFFGGSRILAIDPVTRGVEEIFSGQGEGWFYTGSRGKHQLLPNGNILITETQNGRAFEVTPDDEVVWSFINRYDELHNAHIQQAERFPDGYLQREVLSCK